MHLVLILSILVLSAHGAEAFWIESAMASLGNWIKGIFVSIWNWIVDLM